VIGKQRLSSSVDVYMVAAFKSRISKVRFQIEDVISGYPNPTTLNPNYQTGMYHPARNVARINLTLFTPPNRNQPLSIVYERGEIGLQKN
jgi:hypothetical protein